MLLNRDSELLVTGPWLFRDVPALVAHRGDAQNYPENSLSALKAAVDAGARFIEFDIQLSKDGIPFLIHDDNLLRSAGLDISVFDVDMAQVSKVSVGEPSRYGDQYLSETPISLEALCVELNKWPDVHSFIEIKRESIDHFGLEKVVSRVLDATKSLDTKHTIISFCVEAIELVQKLSDTSIGWVIRRWDELSLQRIEELSPEFVFCNYQKIPKGERLPKNTAIWVLYEIDNLATAVYWRNRGADLVESMAVKPMLRALGGKEV